MIALHQIATALTNKGWSDLPRLALTGIEIDSRRCRRGSLFVALPGETHDGHEFVASAFSQGATAALVSRVPSGCERARIWRLGNAADLKDVEYREGESLCIVVPNVLQGLQRLAAWWREQHPECRVVGVTGSLGKTTTKELVASVLAQDGPTLRNPGNYNNEIGLPLTLLQMDRAHRRAVLEMGMYDLGEIAQLARLARPAVGVVTNVRPIHLERLGSLERIAQAKSELVQALPPAGAAVLNGDDPLVRAMADQTDAERVLTFGFGRENELVAEDVENRGLDGIRLTLRHAGRTRRVALPLLGTHSAWTALAAAGAGVVEGLSWDQIVAGLEGPAEPIRMVVRETACGARILDDSYNAGPASTIGALNVLASVEGRRIAVLGDMLELGAEETRGHREVGARAAQVADLLITVGPRARIMAQTALDEGMSPVAIRMVDSNEEATESLSSLLESGDVVLVKGSRGMAMEEIVAALGGEG